MAGRVLHTADRLIDGTGAAPIDFGAVLTEGDRIVAVGRQADFGTPDGAAVHAAPKGATLMPGLIEAHVHLAYSGDTNLNGLHGERLKLSYPAMALRAAAHAQAHLVHGFTSVRDMHAPGGVIVDLREAINAGQIVGPRIKAPGRGLTVTGGHMDLRMFAEHMSAEMLTHPCTGADGFRNGARRELKHGADFIKVNTCVSSSKVPGIWWRPEMTPEEIRAACDEAHVQGTRVAAHTSGGPPLHATVENGVDIVEHAHWVDENTVELMVARGTYVVPTLLVNERNFEIPGKTPSAWGFASREAKWVSLERLRKAGVKVGSGTDAGFMVPHGTMNWRELQLLMQGGYTALEAIHAATAINAELMELDTGELKPGKLADLLVVAGNPLSDIAVLADAGRLTVWLGGRKVAEAGRLSAHAPAIAA